MMNAYRRWRLRRLQSALAVLAALALGLVVGTGWCHDEPADYGPDIRRLRSDAAQAKAAQEVLEGQVDFVFEQQQLLAEAPPDPPADDPRFDSIRCAIMYAAETFGARRKLTSTGKVGLKSAPAGFNWRGYPDDWDRCKLCNEGYACNALPLRAGR